MPKPTDQENEYLTFVDVPFDDEEMALLCEYAAACRVPMGQLVRSTMRELLLDDKRAHGGVLPDQRTLLM